MVVGGGGEDLSLQTGGRTRKRVATQAGRHSARPGRSVYGRRRRPSRRRTPASHPAHSRLGLPRLRFKWVLASSGRVCLCLCTLPLHAATLPAQPWLPRMPSGESSSPPRARPWRALPLNGHGLVSLLSLSTGTSPFHGCMRFTHLSSFPSTARRSLPRPQPGPSARPRSLNQSKTRPLDAFSPYESAYMRFSRASSVPVARPRDYCRAGEYIRRLS